MERIHHSWYHDEKVKISIATGAGKKLTDFKAFENAMLKMTADVAKTREVEFQVNTEMDLLNFYPKL